MQKKEEIDLFLLLKSLSDFELNELTSVINASRLKNKNNYFILLHALLKSKTYNKDQLLEEISISGKELNRIKFKLFKIILDFKIQKQIAIKRVGSSDLIEFEVLLNAGLFRKALRKLEKIKSIANETCEFEYFLLAQRLAIESSLYFIIGKNNEELMTKAYQELGHYQNKYTNLNEYRKLSNIILVLHYEFLDKRALDRKVILDYLSHPLLQDESTAICVLSRFYFYRILSIIHLGDNNYKKSRQYSMMAFKYISENSSNLRDDYLLKVKSLNNYIDASLHLEDIQMFDKYYSLFKELILANISTKDHTRNAKTLQFLICNRINYLWLKKDFDTFLNEFSYFLSIYQEHEIFFQPNIKAEILLSFAKFLFHCAKYKEAEKYCDQLFTLNKTNPTHLIICCVSILRVMINYELGNFRMIPSTINSSKYVIKSRNRFFDIEKLFLSGMAKLKPYNTSKDNISILRSLRSSLELQVLSDGDKVIKTIGLMTWLDSKF